MNFIEKIEFIEKINLNSIPYERLNYFMSKCNQCFFQ